MEDKTKKLILAGLSGLAVGLAAAAAYCQFFCKKDKEEKDK